MVLATKKYHRSKRCHIKKHVNHIFMTHNRTLVHLRSAFFSIFHAQFEWSQIFVCPFFDGCLENCRSFRVFFQLLLTISTLYLVNDVNRKHYWLPVSKFDLNKICLEICFFFLFQVNRVIIELHIFTYMLLLLLLLYF